MKQCYILISIFCFGASLNAQIVIPDPHFKEALLSAGVARNLDNQSFLIDANTNGEIEVAEAAIVSSLIFPEGASFEGIQFFTNLKTLSFLFNNIEQLDYDLPLLEMLWCDNNQLTHLDLSHFPRLNWLNCGGNLLTSLDLRQNEMYLLFCPNNLLQEVHFGTLAPNAYIDVSNNRLTDLEIISHDKHIHRIEISGNLLTHFNVEAQSFDHLICSNTSLTELDLSKIVHGQEVIFGDFLINDNPFLTRINFKNDALDFCIPPANFNCTETTFEIQNNVLLETVCADEGSEMAFLQPFATASNFTLTTDCNLATNDAASIADSVIYPNPASSIVTIRSSVQ